MAERRRKVTIEQIEQALISNGGWFTQAAKALGCSHQAISKRVQQSERLQRAVEDTKARYLDLAESKLVEAIKNGESWAICFYLKCQGRQRGYVEKAKVDANINAQEPLVIEKGKNNAKD